MSPLVSYFLPCAEVKQGGQEEGGLCGLLQRIAR